MTYPAITLGFIAGHLDHSEACTQSPDIHLRLHVEAVGVQLQ
jgi:hypothetical protein